MIIKSNEYYPYSETQYEQYTNIFIIYTIQ